MTTEYGIDVYEKLSEITKLKFKALIKDSGVEFKQIYQITDLVTLYQYYEIITHADSIVFENRSEFIEEFIKWLEKSIAQYEQESKELNETHNQRTVDKNMNYLENETISHYIDKQFKLLDKMRSFSE